MNKAYLLPLSSLPCVLGTIFALNACEKTPSEANFGTQESAVIYGQDNRQDWYQLTDASLKAKTRGSAVALVERRALTTHNNGNVTYNASTLGDAYGLCNNVAFRDQPTLSHCSGTLIDDDLVLTAGHCVATQSDCNDISVVFDFLYEESGQLAPMTRDNVYNCSQVIVATGNGLAGNVDLGIFKLDRPVVGRTPAELNLVRQTTANTSLVLQGFPSGIPLKVSTGYVSNAGTNQRSFQANLDAFGGDSGSGVRGPDGKVFAVLVSGNQDYVRQGGCVTVNVMPDNQGSEGLMFAAAAVDVMCQRGYNSPRLCGDVAEAVCGDGICSFGESCPEDCTTLPLPSTWRCNADYYNAGDDCDCNCGAYDPDCDDPSLQTWGCVTSGWGGSYGGVCQAAGTCAPNVAGGWQCASSQYNDGQFCDCACGIKDPDCTNSALPVRGCGEGQICNASNACEIDTSTPVDPGTDTDTDTDTDTPIDTDTDTNPPVNTDTDTDTDSPTDTDTDSDTDDQNNPPVDTDTDSDTDDQENPPIDTGSEATNQGDDGCQSGSFGLNVVGVFAAVLLRRRKLRSI